MTTYAQNLILTLALLGAVVYLAVQGQRDVALALIPAVLLLWRRSGRKNDGVVGLLLLGLGLSACHGEPSGYLVEVGARVAPPAAVSPPVLLPQAGLLTDLIEFRPGSVPTCTSGRACIYAASSDNLFYTIDGAGLSLKLHAAQHFRTSSNCSGLSSPAVGDVCYDTSSGIFRFYDASGWETFPEDDLVVHLAGAETITGAKTFNGTPVFGAGLTASGATAINWGGASGDFTFPTGSIAWTGAAGKIATLTQGVATSGSPHILSLVGGAHTTLAASTEASDLVFNLARSVQFSTGALTTQRAARFMSPTYAFVGASTLTNAATVAISGAPVAGTNATITNAHALWVEAGRTTLNGALTVTGGASSIVTSGAALTLTAGAASTWQTSTGALTVDSAAALNLGTTAATGVNVGRTGQTTDLLGNVRIGGATVVQLRSSGGGVGALGAATVYLTTPGQAASGTERYLSLVTRASTSRNLYCFLGTAPGGADTVAFTVRENASDQALTCTISAANTTCSDTSNTFASAAGDRLSVKAVSSAGTAADATCSFEETY